MSEFREGMRDSVPIALGYFTICMAFGLYVFTGGFDPWVAGVLSATNLSSSGQFAGFAVMLASGSLLQLAVTVAVVNLRYFLMSLSLSQKLARGMGSWQRALLAFGVTDEIFALAMNRETVRFSYFLGLMVLPIAGWTGGGVAGAIAGGLLPASLQSAMGVLLYAMFIAIVVPAAKSRMPVLAVVCVAAATSVLLAWLPWVNQLEIGWRIIIATVVAAAYGATVHPVAARRES